MKDFTKKQMQKLTFFV